MAKYVAITIKSFRNLLQKGKPGTNDELFEMLQEYKKNKKAIHRRYVKATGKSLDEGKIVVPKSLHQRMKEAASSDDWRNASDRRIRSNKRNKKASEDERWSQSYPFYRSSTDR